MKSQHFILTLWCSSWMPWTGKSTDAFFKAMDNVEGTGVPNTGHISVITADEQLARGMQAPRRKHQPHKGSRSAIHSEHVPCASQSLIEYFNIWKFPSFSIYLKFAYFGSKTLKKLHVSGKRTVACFWKENYPPFLLCHSACGLPLKLAQP